VGTERYIRIVKIGILTFHDGINYGAFSQVYALKSYLKRCGYDCRVINYKSIGFTKREYAVFLNPRLPAKRIITHAIKILQFKKAQRKLSLTRRIFKQEGLKAVSFDIIIIGSDEVWNCGSDLIGYDPVYFSEGLAANRIVSYAASFGSVENSESIPLHLRDCLSRIDCISVRDDNSLKIMNALFGNKPIQIVLDPTFLTNLTEEAILPKAKDYILIYGFFDENMIKNILDYARASGKTTVSTSYNHPWCDVSIDTLSPYEWLGYFVNCHCVVTTMYHGALLSIQNHKEFCMYKTEYRKHKIGSLLNELGLSDRWIDEDRCLETVFEKKIDYSNVDIQVGKKRKQSEIFLAKSLQP